MKMLNSGLFCRTHLPEKVWGRDHAFPDSGNRKTMHFANSGYRSMSYMINCIVTNSLYIMAASWYMYSMYMYELYVHVNLVHNA